MASIQLHPDPSESHPSYHSNFTLIKSFLENDMSSTPQLSRDLTHPINTWSPNDGIYLWSAISNIWHPLLVIVIQIPENHPWQDRIVALADEISKTPRPSLLGSEVDEIERDCGRLWDGLPVLKWFVAEDQHKGRWERTPENAAFAESEEYKLFCPRWTLDEWTSMNAFAARCNTSLPAVIFKLIPLQVLQHALEVKRRPDALDDNVPAAAVWILHAGVWLFKKGDNGEGVEGDGVGFNPEEITWLYEGPCGYNRERWAFWKKRFGEEAENMEAGEETRTFALKAYDAMITIEGEYERQRAS
jgi:hypothetical protein